MLKVTVISKFTVMLTAAGLLLSGAALADNQGSSEKDYDDKRVKLEIEEWDVPYEGARSRDPWVGGEDLIWFVGQRTHYVGALQPSTGEFKKFDLEDGAGPHTVISNGSDVWYAGNRMAHLGHIDANTGEITKYAPPGDGRRDVHTMDFDSHGNIWFTEQGGNRVGYFNVETHEFTMYDVPTERALPYGVVVHNDQPWVVLFGTNKLATVKGGELHEIELPREANRPRRLAVSDEGHVWYGDYAAGYVGRYNPETGDIDEWQAPSAGDSRPYAVAMDGDGRFWIVETGVQPNLFVAFDPETESFTDAFEVPSGGGAVRHMVYDDATNTIWFGTDMNTIGRAVIQLLDSP